uniref:Uncharacterized protein n=1 Tax=Rhizophora mucronata TaxID=61149 RepID=A0A2P2MDS0_RHIMU
MSNITPQPQSLRFFLVGTESQTCRQRHTRETKSSKYITVLSTRLPICNVCACAYTCNKPSYCTDMNTNPMSNTIFKSLTYQKGIPSTSRKQHIYNSFISITT